MDLDAQWHSYVVPYKLPCIYIFWRYFSCNPEMFHASAPSLGFSRMKFDCNINLTLNISGVLDSIIVSLFDLGFFVAQYAENPRNSKKKSIRSKSRLLLCSSESAHWVSKEDVRRGA